MRRPVPDLKTWLEGGSLSENDLDLLKLLRSLAQEAGWPANGAAAELAYYRIQREIPALIGRKLRVAKQKRDQHDQVKVYRRRQRGTKDWHVLLVRTKAYELGIGHRRRAQEEAAHLARQDLVDEQARRVVWKKADLTPTERRAVELLGGASRTAKKNFLEADAITLADAVIAEWFSPRGKPGRPIGSKIKLAGKEMRPRLPSVAEVIEAVLPVIEQLAGKKASPSVSSTMIEAIASAVQSSSGLMCTPELAAGAVRKLRPTGGSSSN